MKTTRLLLGSIIALVLLNAPLTYGQAEGASRPGEIAQQSEQNSTPEQAEQGSTPGQTQGDSVIVLNRDSIIHMAFENSPSIAAAWHRLKSAEYNFKLFESEYTQFTPLVLDSRLRRKSGDESSGELSAGMEKEFFDGSSLSLNVGSGVDRVPGETYYDQFVESRLEFPLFSSNRKLSRVIKRTFEENDLYSANLDYVETVREGIRRGVERYYDLLPRAQALEALRDYRKRLALLLAEERVGSRPADRAQVEDELNSLDSSITGWEVRVASTRIRLQKQLVVESLDGMVLEPIPFGIGADEYFGRYYVDESYTAVMAKALANNTEIRVLRRVIENARERKRLAEQGRWDMFVSTGGRYSYTRDHGRDNDYAVDVGLKIKKFDAEVWKYSRRKAEADILNTEARIRELKLDLGAEIQELKGEVESQRQQLQSLHDSRQSREQVYTFKLKRYLEGEESIDNLIQSFRSLVDTGVHYYEAGNDYFDNIRDLDDLCGVNYEKLGLVVE